MRVSRVLAFVVFACVCLPARAADPAHATSNVTVNLDALPVPMPRFKPSQDEMRPLAQSRPRPKPGIMAPIPDDAPAEPDAEATPVAQTASVSVPIPRAKPAEMIAAVSPTVAPAVPPPPPLQPAPPPSPPAVPVAIVSKPVTDETFPVEITGTPYDPDATRTPIDPTAGFAILSRVRFSRTGSTLSPQAHAALDGLAARLLSSRERVRLAAFSGKVGGDSSEARRLSLTRALAIRTYLVSKGVPIERVDVLAFGGPPEGVSDRVDVLVRGI